jgi:excinuclease ABC subunit A
MDEMIRVRGAREHNLKDISIDVPRNRITVITGLSGSGKSSLAFDTIYAEGQRRYMDSLSTYARQFLERLKKPAVDSLVGLSPAIAIDQKSVGLNPRSTVGTVTEIFDYLRLLFAKAGAAHCPDHGVELRGSKPSAIVDEVLALPAKTRLILLAPMVSGRKGEFLAEFQKWSRMGFVQAKVDGQFIDLEGAKKLAKTKFHDIDLVVDKLVVKPDIRVRLAESVNKALQLAGGRLVLEFSDGTRQSHSIKSACPVCGFNLPDLEPRFFSFNNPRGACPTCHGLGTIDITEVHAEPGESGARGPRYEVKGQSRRTDDGDDSGQEDIEPSLSLAVCPDCQGTRLKREVRAVKVSERSITELAALSALDLREALTSAKFQPREQLVAPKIIKQIVGRLEYMIRVGTGYLSMDRATRTLSGGEAQRIRLATQVGSGLIGVLYVLDEPSIGLHPRDHSRLLGILREIKDLGNTVLLVEHDEETILTADHLIDIGPRAGRLGGQVIAAGPPDQVIKAGVGSTSQYLSGRKRIPIPAKRRSGNGQRLVLKGASGNNLKDVDLIVPLGTFISVTGVSGSGKSTLIMDTLYRALAKELYGGQHEIAPFKSLIGANQIDKVIHINQNPIGRTPRSTPATYTGLLPLIRDLFASLPDSQVRGFAPGRFSFNVKGGRCEACQGAGSIAIEMHFMPDVFVQCDACQGRRYNGETLAIRYRGKSIADVLEMTVAEALKFFENHTQISRKVETLHRVGLDYMTLGQSSTTLSGGEAQRVKLSRELSKRSTGKTFYILDEPTTGLHFEDIDRLVSLLQSLVDHGNTVLVIEHNMDVVKAADHVVDLGPEGGREGGQIVFSGTPEALSKLRPASPTSIYIAKALESSGRA